MSIEEFILSHPSRFTNLFFWGFFFSIFFLEKITPIFKISDLPKSEQKLNFFYFLSLLLIVSAMSVPLGRLFNTMNSLSFPYGQWVANQHIALQVIAIIFLFDLQFYFIHRLTHKYNILRKFHEIHHCLPVVDLLGVFRLHLVDALIRHCLPYVFIFYLGFSPLALIVSLAALRFFSLYSHSNITLYPRGVFRFIIGSPQFHQWHHSVSIGNKSNYAVIFPFIDYVFGTLYLPKEIANDIGDQTKGLPDSFIGQFLYPFRRL